MGGTVAILSTPAEFTPSGRAWHGQIAPYYQSAANAFGASSALSFATPRFGFVTNLAGRRVNTLRTGDGIDSHAAATRFLGLPSTVFGERLPDTAFTGYGGSFHSQIRLGQGSQLVGHYERSQQDGGKRYDQLLGGDGNWIADLWNLMLDFGYLRYQHFALGPFDQFSLSGSYNAQREERVNQGGNGNPNGSITHQYEKTKVWGLQFQLDKRFRRFDWLLGGEGYHESIAAPSFSTNPVSGAVSIVRPRVPDAARYLMHGLYTQGTWQPLSNDRLRLSGALRYGGASYWSRVANSPIVNGQPLWPDDSLASNAFTGRGGVVAWITDVFGVHAHYSRGFRVPNVTDLGTVGLQGNGVYEAAVADVAGRNAMIGDRADDLAQSTGRPVEPLRPEFTDNVDYGVRVRHSRIDAGVNGFWMRLDNTIVSQTLILPQGAVGQPLGEQTISRQLPTGAVYVPISNSPVLVRANFSGARMRGVEQSLRLKLSSSWTLAENLTYIYAEDSRTGLPPDIEPGIPPLTINPMLAYRPSARRYWFELYSTVAWRQDRLSSLALSDRRIGNPRSRSSIQTFFNNGARTRGIVANGILLPTGETLALVQNRVLGTANSAPQFSAIPGYGIVGLRAGYSLGERVDVFTDFYNIGDKNYRGIGWGIDGPGRGITLRLRYRF
jgi:hemoglobin/transferrin/lactoferrin receptor protein